MTNKLLCILADFSFSSSKLRRNINSWIVSNNTDIIITYVLKQRASKYINIVRNNKNVPLDLQRGENRAQREGPRQETKIYLSIYLSICCDADMGNAKRLMEKHIYSSNKNKIQVNLVKK